VTWGEGLGNMVSNIIIIIIIIYMYHMNLTPYITSLCSHFLYFWFKLDH